MAEQVLFVEFLFYVYSSLYCVVLCWFVLCWFVFRGAVDAGVLLFIGFVTINLHRLKDPRKLFINKTTYFITNKQQLPSQLNFQSLQPLCSPLHIST